MRRGVRIVPLFLLCLPLFAKQPPRRPHILGIAQVHIFVKDLPAAYSFYSKVLRPDHDCNWCEEVPGRSLLINGLQGIVLTPAPSPTPTNLIEEIAFATDDLAALRRYLVFHKVTISKPSKSKEAYLIAVDPEGHRIAFLEWPANLPKLASAHPPAARLIHAGFVVHDRDVEDRFYKDILGFHVYWHGGMKDGDTDWVDMQVPDGTDWLEYMLNVSTEADRRTLGVMNHIAIGVSDIKVAAERLQEDGVIPFLDEPKIGRDGKWQLNLYDQDGTRVELMEFTPAQKPCCSDYTGPHPGQKL